MQQHMTKTRRNASDPALLHASCPVLQTGMTMSKAQAMKTTDGKPKSANQAAAAFAIFARATAARRTAFVNAISFIDHHESSSLPFAYGVCGKNWKHEQRIRGESPLVANG